MIRRQGFTLIELLIVVTIVAILAGSAVPYVQDYVDQTRTGRAKADVDEIRRALMLYETQIGRYNSTTIASLVGPFLVRNLPDPWGNAYKVSDASSTVYSLGPDGAISSDDIFAEYRPKMAATRVTFVDSDGDGMVSTADILDVKMCRPITGNALDDLGLTGLSLENGAGATIDSVTKKSDFVASIKLGYPGAMVLSTTRVRIVSPNVLEDSGGVDARADSLKIVYE